MISANQLTKDFYGTTVVDRLTFKVAKGEIVGFLGPNGAGKTTTMRMLTGYYPPSSGSAKVAGFNVADKPLEVRQEIGYLPESVPLYPSMRVEEFVEFAGQAHRLKGGALKNAVDETLERCNLIEVRHQLISTISRGYRQRVGLAQAIVHRPKVIILDEPTVGLDPSQVQDFRALIHSLAEEATVLLSSHILAEVEALCSRVLILVEGRIQAQGTPARIAEDLDEDWILKLRTSKEWDPSLVAKIRELSGVSQVEWDQESGQGSIHCKERDQTASQIVKMMVAEGIDLYEMRTSQLSLEEVFLKVLKQSRSRLGEPLGSSDGSKGEGGEVLSESLKSDKEDSPEQESEEETK